MCYNACPQCMSLSMGRWKDRIFWKCVWPSPIPCGFRGYFFIFQIQRPAVFESKVQNVLTMLRSQAVEKFHPYLFTIRKVINNVFGWKGSSACRQMVSFLENRVSVKMAFFQIGTGADSQKSRSSSWSADMCFVDLRKAYNLAPRMRILCHTGDWETHSQFLPTPKLYFLTLEARASSGSVWFELGI